MASSTFQRTIRRVIRSTLPAPILLWRQARHEKRRGEVEWGLVRYLCQAERDSIDIGACRGSYTLAMRQHSRFVHAFEPMPRLADELNRRFASRVAIHNVAISNQDGEATLFVPLTGEDDTGLASLTQTALLKSFGVSYLRTPIHKLDTIYKGDVGFIKIDVEGHEAAVLEGGRETLIRCQPRLLIEIEERHVPGSTDRISRFLAGLGFKGFFCHASRLCSVEEFDPRVHQNPANAPNLDNDRGRQEFPDYINNFLFFACSEAETLARQVTQVLASRQ
jgi:FkbM family methyltransferase